MGAYVRVCGRLGLKPLTTTAARAREQSPQLPRDMVDELSPSGLEGLLWCRVARWLAHCFAGGGGGATPVTHVVVPTPHSVSEIVLLLLACLLLLPPLPCWQTWNGTIHTSKSLNGPWETLADDTMPSCNNPAPLVLPNGTIYILCNQDWSVKPLYTAPSLTGVVEVWSLAA
jgi:hypothetical protein